MLVLAAPSFVSAPYPPFQPKPQSVVARSPLNTQVTFNMPQNQSISQLTPMRPFFPNGSGASNRFAVIGDAGTGDLFQTMVARQLSRWQQMSPFNAVMVLGDNVYQNGEPALFQDRILRPYQPLLNRGVQFFPVLGNHDVKKGFGNWQLAYWGVPPYYHFKMGSKGSEVEFLAIDTNLFIPGVNPEWLVNSRLAEQKASAQLQWLEQTLASSTASMKVVYGHHPVFSRGAYAKPERAMQQYVLAQRLEPLLRKYGVDLYMAGHEHHYEKPALVNGVYHLVSGAAGKLDSAKRGGLEGNGLLKRLHFMLFEITPQGLMYRTISSEGTLLDYGNIPRKQAVASQLNLTA